MPKPKADENDALEESQDNGDIGDADDQADDGNQQNVDLRPVGKKIPESGDTLRKRSDYFRKRH